MDEMFKLAFFKRFLMPYAMDKLHNAAKNINLQKKACRIVQNESKTKN